MKQDAPVYGLFSLESDELCTKACPNHGKGQQVWAAGACLFAQELELSLRIVVHRDATHNTQGQGAPCSGFESIFTAS